MLGGSVTHNSSFRRRAPAKIIFTATTTTFAIPSGSTPTTGTITATSTITTTGGNSLFSGATGWINSGSVAGVQNTAWQLSADPGSGGERNVNVRFNQFTLAGICSICGVVLIPTSNGYLLGNIYPGSGRAYNTGTSASILRFGTRYSLPGNSFAVPGRSSLGSVSAELISSSTYTITLEIPGILSEKDNHLR